MSRPDRRRRIAAVGLAASLAGLPVLLVAAAGPPAVDGLPSWRWVTDGFREQYLPVEPLLAALGLLAWVLWGYAVLVTVLRVVAVAAARRGMAGSLGLLSFSNLVTLAPLRSLVDAAVGVSLLASAPHAVAAPVTLAGPPAVVRSVDGSAGWDRAQQLLGAVQPAATAVTQPGAGQAAQLQPPAVTSSPVEDAECPPGKGRAYVVQEGDSLWRIAERELGDGHRWQDLFAANQGRRMPDGQLLRDAGLILPGWQLLLPALDRVDPPPATARPTPADPRPAGGRPEPPAPRSTPPPPPDPATTSAEDADGQQAERREVVELPSGSMVGISLAVGIAAALVVAGLRRRRHRRPLWPPAPARPAGRGMGETARLLAFAAARATHPIGDAAGLEPAPPPPRPRPRVPGPPRDPRDPTPARVVIAEQQGGEVAVDLAGFGAIAVTGPGADGLARACLVGLVAAGDPTAVEGPAGRRAAHPRCRRFPGPAPRGRPARGAAPAGNRAGAPGPAAGGP
jgi:hypothetical protein